jgi:predicted dehydrogenase
MNLLVIGAGSAGQRHLRALASVYGGVAHLYVYRGNHKRGLIAKDLKTEDFSCDPIQFYGAKELIDSSEMTTTSWDLVIIATPPASHLEYLRFLVSCSKRIIIEKPISVTLADAESIYELAKSYDIPIIIGYQMAFHPLKKLILDSLPNLGEIHSCSTVFSENLSSMNPFRNMKDHHLSTPEGGGVFLSLSHDLEFLLSIFNQNSAKNPEFSDKFFDSNNVLTKCIFHSLVFTSTGHSAMTNEMSLLPGATRRAGVICGENARIEWDLVHDSFRVIDMQNKVVQQELITIEKDQLFQLQIQHIMSMESSENFSIENLTRSLFITEVAQLVRN